MRLSTSTKPSYIFRLSLNDSFAMNKMLEEAKKRGLEHVGMLLPNTAWGRSNMRAAENYLRLHPLLKVVRTEWYNWEMTPYEVFTRRLSVQARKP